MFRASIAAALLAAFSTGASVARAQPRGPVSPGVTPASPFGPAMLAPSTQQQLPLSPGVVPASPFGPGMPLFPAGAIPQRPGTANTVFFPVALPWGWGLGWGYETFNPWTGYGYAYGGLVPSEYVAPEVVFVEPPRRPEPVVVVTGEVPATLSVRFPAAAEVWLGGKKLAGDPTADRVLTSPVLKPNQKYTFDVRARWTSGDKTFESTRSVTLTGGDRSRLTVLSGDEVNK